MISRRVVCLHAGTHKTGTKTLQTFLAVNAQQLRSAGIFVPKTGRVDLGDGAQTPGHHRIPWALMGESPADLLADLVGEVAAAALPVTIVSSEEFQFLHERPDRLAQLAANFAAAGYEVHAVVYLRAQPSYAQSLYGEFAKAHNAPPLDAYVDEIRTTGRYAPAPARTIIFRYSDLLARLEAGIGSGRVILRAYRAADDEWLLRDFMSVIAAFLGGLSLAGIQNPLPHANDGLRVRDLIALQAASPAASVEAYMRAGLGLLERPLTFITRAETLALLAAFGEDNRRIGERAGIAIAFTGEADLAPADDPGWERAEAIRSLIAGLSAG